MRADCQVRCQGIYLSRIVNIILRRSLQATISTMGLDQKEEYMKIMTSWKREALEEVALNSLREGLPVEIVVKITGLTVERVQQLQAELQSGN